MSMGRTTEGGSSGDKYDVDDGGGESGGVMGVGTGYIDDAKHRRDLLTWEGRVRSIAPVLTEKRRQ
jgi:hypothetical protein